MEKNVKTKIFWKIGEKTGEYIDTFGWCSRDENGDLDDFWWEEGNGSCDCNRAGHFFNEYWKCGHTIEILDIIPLDEIK